MYNGNADNRGFYTLEQATYASFQELPAQRQHVNTGYAQQSHFSPPKKNAILCRLTSHPMKVNVTTCTLQRLQMISQA